MSNSSIVQEIAKDQLKNNIPEFSVGDTVRVHVRIVEGATEAVKGGGAKTAEKGKKSGGQADKERIQVFAGTVIARKGSGLSETFSIHRIAYGEGMERVFLLHSPRIALIEVTKFGQVRRSKLYYLRGASGKKAKVQERLGGKKQSAKAIVAETASS
jgi:large subunit ribosomal protein L19